MANPGSANLCRDRHSSVVPVRWLVRIRSRSCLKSAREVSVAAFCTGMSQKRKKRYPSNLSEGWRCLKPLLPASRQARR